MITKTKFLIDRALAVPLAWVANVAARSLALVVRRDHDIDPPAVRAIVVAKLLGMGSIVQATPLLRDLRRTFRKARLTFLTTQANRELIERLDLVDEVLFVDDATTRTLFVSTARTIVELLKRKIDLYIDLEVYSASASILSLVSGARNRLGFYRHSARFKKGIFTHLTVFNPRAPICDIYRQLHVAAGGVKQGEPIFGPLAVREADSASLKETLARSGIDLAPRYVVVNPNASDLLLERRWPAERFVELISALARRGEQIVLIGATSETEYVGVLVGRLPTEARAYVRDTSGRLSLGELFALLNSAACVVTNDTGPMHFAIALDRPTVCLFGPVSPDHYGVGKRNVETLYNRVYCSPCAHELDEPPCAGNNVCMQFLPVDDVLAAVERQLAGQPAVRNMLAPAIMYQAPVDGGALGVIVRSSIPTPAAG
jgi:ADP-heptose:LPS heptosyltransferase